MSKDVLDSVIAGGIDPNDVDAVIVSHIHYEHTGNPDQFPNAKYHVGPGSLELIEESTRTIDPQKIGLPNNSSPKTNPLFNNSHPTPHQNGKNLGPSTKPLTTLRRRLLRD